MNSTRSTTTSSSSLLSTLSSSPLSWLAPAARSGALPGPDDARHTLTAARRRRLLLALVGTTVASSGAVMARVALDDGVTAIEAVTFVLFLLNLSWISTWFYTFVVGFLLTTSDRDPWTLRRRRASSVASTSTSATRTAITVPICHEDVARVVERVTATWRSVVATGQQARFDIFVLSDSSQPDVVAEEESLLVTTLSRLAPGHFYYRRRTKNEGRKAGNILEFLQRWGGRYAYMLVLDADSVMGGKRIVSLVQQMDASPRLGILQTVPIAHGRKSLFGRCVQFAIRLNGPLLSRGLSFWQLGEGNYWGHNALLRVDAFCDNAGFLPLAGKAPLGGDILSHDFVEAALVLRAGYSVWLDTDDGGSWEEVPAHLDGWAARDRRWCQGSLQHLKVFFSEGFRSASRIHILGGVTSYLSSLSWLTLLVTATIDAVDRAHTTSTLQTAGLNRFAETALLVGLPLSFLIAPHVFSVVAAVKHRAAWGGLDKLVASSVITLVFALLLAPVSMIIHSVFVTRTLLGQAIGWGAQLRDDEALPWRAGGRTAAVPTAIGIVWTMVLAAFAPDALLWLAPVLVSLLLAWPFAVVTSWPRLGLALRDARLLMTPEEILPPAELRTASSSSSSREAIASLLTTPPPSPRTIPLHRLGRHRVRSSGLAPLLTGSAPLPSSSVLGQHPNA